jgi:GNAT superfamily N-acetyltransferase
MNHQLDNMIWHALQTGNREMAILDEQVGYYRPDIAPFAAMAEPTADNFTRLHQFLPAEKTIALTYPASLQPDTRYWKIIREMDCCQMIYEKPVSHFTGKGSEKIQPLTDEHIPQMLELTAMTRPGPFFQNTILFGNYFGIFENGQLAAMCGQRMNPVPFLEVSAVCTHPDHRGKGYAKALMLRVMELILAQSFTPFLHVLSENATAIGLYESIGFRTRTRLNINMVKKIG